jgi:predicted RNase H-like HicB family nuclease
MSETQTEGIEDQWAANTSHYSMVIAWSDEDNLYLVRLPEWEDAGRLDGPVAHGSSYQEAATEGTIALGLQIETAQDLGWELPAPARIRLD